MLQPAAAEERIFHPDPVRNAIYAKFRRPDPSTAIKSPQALALRVELSQQSFLKTNKPAEDIRIDVLFNGQLTHSNMWPKRLSQEERKKEQLTGALSGLRNHWMLERAWVIVPPDLDADGSQRQPSASGESLEDRWKSIQQAVRAEATARGTDNNGTRPVTANYFMEVSKLTMPPELKKWCNPQGQKFGVIDVVLSYGQGSKDSSCKKYLSEPTRLRSSKFKSLERETKIFEGISLRPALETYHDGNRYNFRRAAPNASDASRDSPSVSKSPVKNRSGTDPLLSPFSDRIDTIAGPTVNREGNTITASQRLPVHLSEAVTSAGYTLQQPSTRTRAQMSGKRPPSHPSSGLQQSQVSSIIPSRPISRSAAPVVIQLEEIAEEDEGMPSSSSGNVRTSSPAVPRPGPLGFSGSSAVAFGSSQESGISQPQSMTSPFNSFGPPFEGTLVPAPRLPVPQISPGLRFRQSMPDSPDGESPRKKRRLAGRSLPQLSDIRVPEGSIGITNRGVFTKLGSPRDRSRFNSFTLSSHVDPQQVYVGRPPPMSPITPDRDSFRRADPPIKRLVFKANGQPFHTFDLRIPFRLSELPVLASLAGDRADVQRAQHHEASTTNGPARRILPPAAMPSTPPQSTRVPTRAAPPRTPIAGRTRSQATEDDDDINPGTSRKRTGIHHTPVPLPRYTRAPPTPATPKAQTTDTTTNTTTNTPLPPPHSSTSLPTRPRRGTQDLLDPNHPHAQMERAFRTFETPALSRDCAVTYAQPGREWSTEERQGARGREWSYGMPRGFGGGVVRQVRSEWMGGFEEEGVVVGVRFLVV